VQLGRLDEATIAALAEEIAAESPATTAFDSHSDTVYLSQARDSSLQFISPELEISSHTFPVPDWERYELIEFISEGGMGRVFKAHDPRLKRPVALKFIRGDQPRLIQRFFQEARAQGRIQHDYICKVYEVGEVKGHPYIAMQYIEGPSLKDARDELTIEQKVKAVKEVAEALHAAHRLGVIHRDVKPANIMIERNEEGDWHPYIMDFGLAREVEAEGITLTGMLVGTPAYMAPEQVLMDENLDRRIDIYSLGATLYDLLVGKPPISGANGMEIIAKLNQSEPTPLRKLDRRIPLDLETIVMKCLEREPQLRYETAKALAEDLARYLDGEPIEARPASWSYRLSKKTKKHKAVVAVLGLAFLVMLILAAMVLQARWAAAEQARVAQQFGQQLEKIEGIMRHAYMLPLHDTRREKALIKVRMQEIEDQMQRIGRVGAGPGHYALGQGYLALHEYDLARQHLEQAWRSGYQAPEVGYALGQVMGVFYQKGLVETQRIADKGLREARKQELERNYRTPALTYLKASGSVKTEATAYVEGLIAFYEEHYDEALQKAAIALQQAPWLYEARKLIGDVYIVMGGIKEMKGDYQSAIADYTQAGKAYQAAIEMARSDATLYKGECGRCLEMIEVAVKQGTVPKEMVEQGLSACDNALLADPENAPAYNDKSWIYWRWGEYQITYGEDPRPLLEKAIEMAQQAVHYDPLNSDAYNNLGYSYETRGEYEITRGLDPRATFYHAIESFQRSIKLNPNFANTYNALGFTYWKQAEYEKDHGIDPRATFERAIESFQRSIAINMNFVNPYNNMGGVYKAQGDYEMALGLDPGGAFTRAVESSRRAIAINPNYAKAYYTVGSAFLRQGCYLLEQGIDPTTILTQAREALEKAAQLNPSRFDIYLRKGETELSAARWAIQQDIN
ncbi:MAG: protein kinase, partial [Acidobacteriota bacterium]